MRKIKAFAEATALFMFTFMPLMIWEIITGSNDLDKGQAEDPAKNRRIEAALTTAFLASCTIVLAGLVIWLLWDQPTFGLSPDSK